MNNNQTNITKIDMISLEIPEIMVYRIPSINLKHIVETTNNEISKTIIITFTNQIDRDQLYELLTHTKEK
jgi:hypothetical protein